MADQQVSVPVSLEKARGFVMDESGRPAPGVVVLASVELDGGRKLPVGMLASDAAGYVSFDLREAISQGPPVQVHLTPVGEEAATITLPCATTTATGLAVPFLLQVSSRRCADCDDGGHVGPRPTLGSHLPAVQRPDPLDWKLSPGSFAADKPIVMGEGACQVLLPTEAHKFATTTYRFAQVVRRFPLVEEGVKTHGFSASNQGTGEALNQLGLARISGWRSADSPEASGTATMSMVPPPPPGTPSLAAGISLDLSKPLEVGQVLSFRQTWSPLGHSLGKIAYSLPLAPCESVNIAIIDWSRSDQAVRTDQAKSTENLVHSQRRDRSIEEVIDATLSESQGGWSLQAGVGVAAGVPGLAVTGGLGYGTAQSWGERDLTGSSLQDLHDSILQKTSVVRQLNSTVVVQSSQQEKNYVETRTVTNHNHCHALTVQYHEVLQHLRVDTCYERRSWALLIPYKLLTFDWQTTLRYRTILETALLDRKLALCFDAIVRVHYCSDAYGEIDKKSSQDVSTDGEHKATPVAPTISRYELVLTTGDRNTWGEIWVRLGLKNGQWKLLYYKPVHEGGVEDGNEVWANTDLTIDVTQGEAIGVDPTQVERVKVSWMEADGGDAWPFKGIRVKYQTSDKPGFRAEPLIEEKKTPYLMWFDNSWGQVKDWVGAVKTPAGPTDPTTKDPIAKPEPEPKTPTYSKVEDACCEQRLLVHLQANVGYYSRACWLLQDPTERVILLDRLFASLPSVRSAIDPIPVAVNGNYVAFPFNGAEAPEPAPSPELKPRSDIVSLPTRGLFAETHLSNCNACEQRDVTRFWKWEESPCPEKAPEITEIAPGPKGEPTTVEPATLPNPVVQVMNAPNAPDPTGLAAAFKLLGTPDIFRDMSTRAEVSKLLEGLISGSVSLAQAKEMATKAKEALASGGAGKGSGDSTRSAPNEPDAGQQVDKLNAIKHARDQGLIDDQAASDAAEGVLGGDLLASAGAGVPTDKAPGRPPEQPILDEVSKRPRLKESFDTLVNAGFELRLAGVASGAFKIDLGRRLLLIKDINVSYATSADWVEAAVKRAHQLDEDLRRGAIRDRALVIWGTTGLTDLEKMARVYEWSVWFWQYPTRGGSDVLEGLMGDMMVVLTDLKEGANPLSQNDGRFHIFRHGASAESSGFKRMFRDAFNQVRHATGSLQVSLLYGKVGFELAQSREDDNTADCRLNIACKAIADSLKSAAPNFQVENIGGILRRELGDPTQTAPWPSSLLHGDPTPPCKT